MIDSIKTIADILPDLSSLKTYSLLDAKSIFLCCRDCGDWQGVFVSNDLQQIVWLRMLFEISMPFFLFQWKKIQKLQMVEI